jgi:ferredoxin
MSACPIGLYYSFVSPARWFGVHFRNGRGTCIECSACDNVCPVDLRPRDLSTPVPARGGISVTDAPGRNHCLECGDCVRACEWMIAAKGAGPVPLELGYFVGPQAIPRGGMQQPPSLASRRCAR